MEVGAVKQAFNNEVIQLKKNLNQAKIQTIHKLTRKAKTLNERNAPEILKEKLKRKAESAVNEVLIIKKIKPRDIAKFTVTHIGKLNDYLNKSEVDHNKACARLLLHKALQGKYKLIKDRFGNISINDLLMSRQERIKLKKELKSKEKEKKKNKAKKESKINKESVRDGLRVTRDGWEVEMIDNDCDKPAEHDSSDVSDSNVSEDEKESDKSALKVEANFDGNSSDDNNDEGNDGTEDDSKDGVDVEGETEYASNEIGKFVRPPSDDGANIQTPQRDYSVRSSEPVIDAPSRAQEVKPILENKSKKPDKRKENKNKNINEKILNRNFKKQSEELPKVVKVVDPFFVTSTGENYMSIAEPKAPDEIKEEHKQGNRQYRRAMMFGHVPKIKPRKKYENNKFDHDQSNFKSHDNQYKQNGFNNINDRRFNNNKGKPFGKNDNGYNKIEEKTEKLHPSWEAKRKHSSILPFQGKKIVFDDS